MPVPTFSRPRRALRGLGLVALEVALALALVACGASDTPPRSPLDDRGPAPTVPPGVTSFPPPFTPPALTPTAAVPTAPAGAPTSPDRGDPEAAAGAAIEVLAQRMAVSATRLSLVSVEPVDWPSACLGAALPGVACAQVVTPGYRVILRYDTGSRHEVHTGRGGLAVWVPQETLQATVREAELGGAPLVLEAAGRTVRVLLGPGTQRLGGPMGALKAGDRVTLGVDDPRDGGPLRAVWIARE
ncbi:MAG: hypothetical protein AB7G21_11270 [Dehalococcoidia bacterium]